MDCFRGCFLSSDTINWLLVGAFLGGLTGAVVTLIATCAALGGALSLLLSPAGGAGLALVCIVEGVVAPEFNPPVVLGFLVGAAVGIILALIARAAFCAANCAFGNAGIVGAALPGGDAAALLGASGISTCASAQSALAEAQRQLGLAIAARDAQRVRVAQARQRRNAARVAVTAALGAVGAALASWNPWAIVAAAVAAVAAGAALAYAEGRLAAEQAILAPLEAAIAGLQAAVDAAQALVNSLCPPAQAAPGTPPNLVVGGPSGGIIGT